LPLRALSEVCKAVSPYTPCLKSDCLSIRLKNRGYAKDPFVRDDTLFPDWAPDGKDKKELATYFDNLRNRLKEKGI